MERRTERPFQSLSRVSLGLDLMIDGGKLFAILD